MTSFTSEQRVLFFALMCVLVFLFLIELGPKFIPTLLNRVFGWLGGGGAFLKRREPSIQIGNIRLTDDDRKRHTHIIGATGVGKSVLIEHLLYRDLLRGYGAIIIDAKGDRKFYEEIKNFTKSINRGSDLHYLSSTFQEESSIWNPVRLGNLSELQSKFFCAANYSHPHYAKAAELLFLDLFTRLCESGETRVSLRQVSKILDEITNHGKDENYKGVYLDFKNLMLGEWTGVLGVKRKEGQQHEISLLDITRNNQILFVDLPTEGKAVQSARIGSLLLQELILISGLRKRMPHLKSGRPFAVYVDEFDAFATESFVSFLNKGRSSDFMIHMAHQTLSDLKKISPTFEGQIMGNPNIRFIFRMDLPEDAERVAKSLGTRLSVKKTWQTVSGQNSGRGSAREVQEFRVHPDDIKTFGIGKCAVSIKTKNYTNTVTLPMINPTDLIPKESVTDRSPLDFKDFKSESDPSSSYHDTGGTASSTGLGVFAENFIEGKV